MQYTKEQYEKAKNISLIEYLKSKGHEFKKEGYRYRHKVHDSLIISEDSKWFWNSRGIFGANAISYLHKAEGLSIPEAVLVLIQGNVSTIPVKEQKQSKPRPLVLPDKADNFHRVFAYLNITRGIDEKIISSLMHDQKIYESLPY